MSGSRVLGLRGRLSKLSAMSAAELLERVRYAAVIRLERRRHGRDRGTPGERVRKALVSGGAAADWQSSLLEARRRARGRFFPSVAQPDAMRRLFETVYRDERAATLRQAALARSHRFEFFGQEFTYGAAIPWQNDPVSGRPWPRVYHADVPVHGGDLGYGDVKYVWELSRQQFVIDLAKSWYLAGTREDLGALQRLVRDWIGGNPYAVGVNWACALEPAFRVFSWLWAYHLTVDDLDDAFHVEWLAAFLDHGRFIERHLEHYSSPYNHLVAEAAALYMLATFLPEFRDAPRWRARAIAVLAGRLPEQFYRDGGSVEQSTFYHHATVGFYLLALLTAKAAGETLPSTITSAVERGLNFSLALTQPDGSTPRIGGADDGKPIRMEHLPFWDFRPYLALGAVLFDRADFKAVAGRFHEDALWLLGPAGLAAFDGIAARPPAQASTSLPDSGYHVLRSDWSPQADYVCFDCGEQAAGMRTDAIPNSMHGHADCLSVTLWIDGRATLVDSGLFAYNCGGVWEDHFRETAAHNTARVDGRDQARHLRKMAWSHSFRARLEAWSDSGTLAWVAGSHDGYDRGPAGVRHHRAVWLRPGHYVVILDEFTGTSPHDLEINWQFAPGVLRSAGDSAARFDDHADVVWMGNGPWSARFAHGGDGPADGWIAPSLGVRQAAPRLTLSGAMNGSPAALLTVVAATGAAAPRITIETFETAGTPAALLSIINGDVADVIAARGIADGGPIDSDAPLAICRVPLSGAAPAEDLSLGGTYVRAGHDAIRRRVQARPTKAT